MNRFFLPPLLTNEQWWTTAPQWLFNIFWTSQIITVWECNGFMKQLDPACISTYPTSESCTIILITPSGFALSAEWSISVLTEECGVARCRPEPDHPPHQFLLLSCFLWRQNRTRIRRIAGWWCSSGTVALTQPAWIHSSGNVLVRPSPEGWASHRHNGPSAAWHPEHPGCSLVVRPTVAARAAPPAWPAPPAAVCVIAVTAPRSPLVCSGCAEYGRLAPPQDHLKGLGGQRARPPAYLHCLAADSPRFCLLWKVWWRWEMLQEVLHYWDSSGTQPLAAGAAPHLLEEDRCLSVLW